MLRRDGGGIRTLRRLMMLVGRAQLACRAVRRVIIGLLHDQAANADALSKFSWWGPSVLFGGKDKSVSASCPSSILPRAIWMAVSLHDWTNLSVPEISTSCGAQHYAILCTWTVWCHDWGYDRRDSRCLTCGDCWSGRSARLYLGGGGHVGTMGVFNRIALPKRTSWLNQSEPLPLFDKVILGIKHFRCRHEAVQIAASD